MGPAVTEPARRNLQAAASASRRFGWISFWSQLCLSVVSALILIFSVSFSATVRIFPTATRPQNLKQGSATVAPALIPVFLVSFRATVRVSHAQLKGPKVPSKVLFLLCRR